MQINSSNETNHKESLNMLITLNSYLYVCHGYKHTTLKSYPKSIAYHNETFKIIINACSNIYFIRHDYKSGLIM